MSEVLFDIIFFGILQPGKDRDIVIQNMATLFKTDAKKLAPYFAGGRKVIKGKINAATAEKYRAALENVGLVIKVESCRQVEGDSAPNQTQASSPDPATTQNTAHTENTGSDTNVVSIAPVGADVLENPVKVSAQKIDDISYMTMAEPGADIVELPVEETAQTIADISGITMAEVGSDVLINPVEVPPLKIDDMSEISLAEAGADIIVNPKPVEKADIPDFSALSLKSENV